MNQGLAPKAMEHDADSATVTVGRTIHGHSGDPLVLSVASARFDSPTARHFGANGPSVRYFGTVRADGGPADVFTQPRIYDKPDLTGPDEVQTSFFTPRRGWIGTTYRFNGSSAAAPHVAAVLALGRQVSPNSTPEALIRDVMGTTSAMENSSEPTVPARLVHGTGFVDAHAFVKTLVDARPLPPLPAYGPSTVEFAVKAAQPAVLTGERVSVSAKQRAVETTAFPSCSAAWVPRWFIDEGRGRVPLTADANVRFESSKAGAVTTHTVSFGVALKHDKAVISATWSNACTSRTFVTTGSPLQVVDARIAVPSGHSATDRVQADFVTASPSVVPVRWSWRPAGGSWRVLDGASALGAVQFPKGGLSSISYLGLSGVYELRVEYTASTGQAASVVTSVNGGAVAVPPVSAFPVTFPDPSVVRAPGSSVTVTAAATTFATLPGCTAPWRLSDWSVSVPGKGVVSGFDIPGARMVTVNATTPTYRLTWTPKSEHDGSVVSAVWRNECALAPVTASSAPVRVAVPVVSGPSFPAIGSRTTYTATVPANAGAVEVLAWEQVDARTKFGGVLQAGAPWSAVFSADKRSVTITQPAVEPYTLTAQYRAADGTVHRTAPFLVSPQPGSTTPTPVPTPKDELR